MATKYAAIFLALSVSTLASPVAEAASALVTPAPAIKGALDLTAVRVVEGAEAIPVGPEYITITFSNAFDFPVSTYLANSGPTPVSGNFAAGTLSAGAINSIVVPTGFIGAMSIVQTPGGREINGDDIEIEISYVIPGGYSYAVADVDVSFVDGFSLPAVCYCNGIKQSGCNFYLWSLNSCPDDDGVGACVNPLRSDLSSTSATTFFAPCQGQAYTYPNDSDANSFGQCQSGSITCCISTAC